jgi:hypothetical protein
VIPTSVNPLKYFVFHRFEMLIVFLRPDEWILLMSLMKSIKIRIDF